MDSGVGRVPVIVLKYTAVIGDTVSLTNLPLLTCLLGSETQEINPAHTCVDYLCGARDGLCQSGKFAFRSLNTMSDDLSYSTQSITAFLLIICFPWAAASE